MSWEGSEFRCPVCFVFYDAAEDASSDAPLFVCGNHHTVCRACVQALQRTDAARCPECREALLAAPTRNRILGLMMQRVTLVCGACALPDALSVRDMQRHARECPEAQVTCPLASCEQPDAPCGRRMRYAALWEHCLAQHAAGPPSTAACVAGTVTLTHVLPEGAASATLYTTTLLGSVQHRWSLAVTREAAEGLRVAVRRFDGNLHTTVADATVAVDCGGEYGLVARLPGGVLRADDAVVDAHKALVVPPALLAAMDAARARVHVAVEFRLVRA